ncbi:hypothetical protein RRF57_009972 [Xylaria bambusicola]|uniref:Uncharacterized protein n=1 Tax=Xylaria bambusicola TaxID=326684 RepID=A0AAN7URJ1_9PEZI
MLGGVGWPGFSFGFGAAKDAGSWARRESGTADEDGCGFGAGCSVLGVSLEGVSSSSSSSRSISSGFAAAWSGSAGASVTPAPSCPDSA